MLNVEQIIPDQLKIYNLIFNKKKKKILFPPLTNAYRFKFV
jgi:hypothetical protein